LSTYGSHLYLTYCAGVVFLRFHCRYSADDFVLPVKGGADYRIESMERLHKGNFQRSMVSETVHDPDDPPQQVRMWRTFARIARDLDNASSKTTTSAAKAAGGRWNFATPSVEAEATWMARMSLWNQRVVDAVVQSIRQGEHVPVDQSPDPFLSVA